MCRKLLVPHCHMWYPVFDAVWGTSYGIFDNPYVNTGLLKDVMVIYIYKAVKTFSMI